MIHLVLTKQEIEQSIARQRSGLRAITKAQTIAAKRNEDDYCPAIAKHAYRAVSADAHQRKTTKRCKDYDL